MKKVCGVILILVMAMTLCACSGTPDVEGSWMCTDAEESYGYQFDVLQTHKDTGEPMGRAYLLPKLSFDLGVVQYYYNFSSKTEVSIIKRTLNVFGGGETVEIYDTLRIETVDGERVLISNTDDAVFHLQPKAK